MLRAPASYVSQRRRRAGGLCWGTKHSHAAGHSDDRQKDLLQPALDQIIDLKHPLVLLGNQIDWEFLDSRFRTVCLPGPGQPGLPTRLVAGLFILKHMHNLSDEVLRQGKRRLSS